MENKEKANQEEISFSDIVVIFIKKKWWFLGTFLTVLALGLVYVFLQPVDHILTYQLELKKKYSNEELSELYPNYNSDLNYLSLQNVPVLFKSEKVFSSIKNVDASIDYQRLRESDSVNITLNEETSIFNIGVSSSRYELADDIAMALITAFKAAVIDKEKTILNEVFEKINNDMRDLEVENTILQDENIAGLEDKIDALYVELDRYIVDYNIELSDRLEENKNNENVSFYNVIIPPNDISNEINTLQKEINVYEVKVLENKNRIIDLNNLTEKLQKDEDIITERIRILSESPIYKTDSDRLQNIGFVIILSIVLGMVITFVVNFIHSSSIREKLKKK